MAPRRKPAQKHNSSSPKLLKTEEDEFPENYDWESEELNRGAPARRYLLKNLAPTVLDGLRQVNKIRPEDPIKWLGQYLLDHSNPSTQPTGSPSPLSVEIKPEAEQQEQKP